jgi:hypothetical protein
MSWSTAPAPIRLSVTAWLVAVACGVLETPLGAGTALAAHEPPASVIVGVGVRVTVFGVAVWLALRLSAGRSWARVTLTLMLSVIGLASLVVDPLLWLAAGHSPAEALRGLTPAGALFGASRVTHVLAVLTATVAMYLPAANRYLRTADVSRDHPHSS